MDFKTSFGDLKIDEPSNNPDGWIVIKSSSVTFDKDEFFISRFVQDFPSYTLIGSNSLEKFKFLNELCGRSPAMRNWLAATSINYSDTTQLPLYLKDCVAPDEYKRINENLIVLREQLAEVVKARNDLAADYAAKLAQLEIKERNVVKKTIGDDNLMKIISLTTESLPLSIQMKIQTYMANSSDADVTDNRRRLAKEYLANFKVSLINLNKVNRIKDIDKLIDELSLK